MDPFVQHSAKPSVRASTADRKLITHALHTTDERHCDWAQRLASQESHQAFPELARKPFFTEREREIFRKFSHTFFDFDNDAISDKLLTRVRWVGDWHCCYAQVMQYSRTSSGFFHCEREEFFVVDSRIFSFFTANSSIDISSLLHCSHTLFAQKRFEWYLLTVWSVLVNVTWSWVDVNKAEILINSRQTSDWADKNCIESCWRWKVSEISRCHRSANLISFVIL